jgi:hypothetical protein
MMQSWTTPLWCVLIALSLTQGQDDQPNDSLKTAIDALSRRQRDLAAAGPNYYVGGGLAQYRFSDRDAVPRDDLAFLATPRDFAGKLQQAIQSRRGTPWRYSDNYCDAHERTWGRMPEESICLPIHLRIPHNLLQPQIMVLKSTI